MRCPVSSWPHLLVRADHRCRVNSLLGLVLVLSCLSYLHFLVIRLVEYPAVYDPWSVWEESHESSLLPSIDESVSEDNTNVLKWFTRRHDNRKAAVRPLVPAATGPVLYESHLPRTILLVDSADLAAWDGEVTCPHKCNVITDPQLLRHADLVVFNATSLGEVPDKRHEDQVYVWYNQQSPTWTKQNLNEAQNKDLKRLDGKFDLTMTYRSDSDVQFSKGEDGRTERLNEATFVELHRHKSKLAYWTPHSCDKSDASKQMIEVMYQLHLSSLRVDVYGDPSSVSCAPLVDQTDPRPNRPYVYKFYLHFSTAPACRDYVDASVWTRALRVGVVPVLFGSPDLASSLPRNSYIAAEKFASAYELVNYLEYLDTDTEAYRQYFAWRFRPAVRVPAPLCQLCKLAYPFRKPSAIGSLEERWYGAESEECLDPEWSGEHTLLIRRYLHLAYFLRRPVDVDDMQRALVLTLILALLSLFALLAFNSDVIRRQRAVAFVSARLVDVGDLIRHLRHRRHREDDAA